MIVAIDGKSVVVVAAAVVLALAVGLLVGATLTPRGTQSGVRARIRRAFTTPIPERKPGFFFLWSCIYLALLLVLPALYARNVGNIKDKIADPIADVIPIGVPLAGALGAVTIGLYGIFKHNRYGEWDPSYGYWHLARPLMGTVLGVFGFFIFIAVIQASGVEPNLVSTTETTTTTATVLDDDTLDTGDAEAGASEDDDGDSVDTSTGGDASDSASDQDDKKGLIIYYLVAFIVGYREESFRELVKRAADLLLRPNGEPPPGPPPPGARGGGPPSQGPLEPDDELDATGIDYTAEPVADEDLDLVVLSPEGNADRVKEYQALAGGGEG